MSAEIGDKNSCQSFFFYQRYKPIYLLLMVFNAGIAIYTYNFYNLASLFFWFCVVFSVYLFVADKLEILKIDRKIKGVYKNYGIYKNKKHICNYLAEGESELSVILAIDSVDYDEWKFEGEINV